MKLFGEINKYIAICKIEKMDKFISNLRFDPLLVVFIKYYSAVPTIAIFLYSGQKHAINCINTYIRVVL